MKPIGYRYCKGSKWKYLDKSGSPINGVMLVAIRDRARDGVGHVAVRVEARRGDYPIVESEAHPFSHSFWEKARWVNAQIRGLRRRLRPRLRKTLSGHGDKRGGAGWSWPLVSHGGRRGLPYR